MLPLKDNIPTDRFPVVTVALIAINIAFFIWQLAYPTNENLSDKAGISGGIEQSSLEYGAIPYRITHPDQTQDCAIGAVDDQFQTGVVCPGTEDYDEAVTRAQENPGADLGPFPLEQAAWFVTLFTSMFMLGGFLH